MKKRLLSILSIATVSATLLCCQFNAFAENKVSKTGIYGKSSLDAEASSTKPAVKPNETKNPAVTPSPKTLDEKKKESAKMNAQRNVTFDDYRLAGIYYYKLSKTYETAATTMATAMIDAAKMLPNNEGQFNLNPEIITLDTKLMAITSAINDLNSAMANFQQAISMRSDDIISRAWLEAAYKARTYKIYELEKTKRDKYIKLQGLAKARASEQKAIKPNTIIQAPDIK